jgi:hypothetical protein
MARRYLPSVLSVPADRLLSAAREKAAAAAARARESEQANPADPGWDQEYDAASSALRAADRRVEALERLQAAQVERAGKRAKAVEAAAADLKQIPVELSASREAVAAAAAVHLKALAKLTAATETHNAAVDAARAKLAGFGLAVRDDLADEGADHAEGTLDGAGVRAGGLDWTPVDPAGLVAHACREVFAVRGPLHPLAEVGKYLWRPHEVAARADGLAVPRLADVGVKAPERPRRPVITRAQVEGARKVADGDYYPGAPGGYYPEPSRLAGRTA